MLKKAIELDPNYALAYAALADLYNTYLHSDAQTAEEKSKYKKLQETYRQRAVEIDPNVVEVQGTHSFVLDDNKKVDEAYASVKRALEINPNYANWFVACFFRFRGLDTLAIKHTSKVLERDPLLVNAYNFHANLLMKLGEYAQAETDYRIGLEINPNHLGCLYRYAELLIRLKRYDEAEKILQHMEKIYPDRDTSWFHAVIYASKGEKENALNTYKVRTSVFTPGFSRF
jgi:tetratricopeptide (TPR) repeat protein